MKRQSPAQHRTAAVTFFSEWKQGQIDGRVANGSSAISIKKAPEAEASGALSLICVFYDGSYAVFSYACASLFYDAFFFYHTACSKKIYLK